MADEAPSRTRLSATRRRIRRIQWAVTVAAAVVAVIHVCFPELAIDAITATLVVVAVLPWLAPLFKTIELPGGLKIEFDDAVRAAAEVEKAGLAAPSPPDSKTYAFEQVTSDPNLALAGLRLELERKLRRLAELNGLQPDLPRARGVRGLLVLLSSKQIIRTDEFIALEDLIRLLDRAVHGAVVELEAAQWALNVGVRVLQTLDERIASARS